MNITLHRQTRESATWPATAGLYVSAFPECERREVAEWEELPDDEPDFHVWEIRTDGNFAGFISVWTLSGFLYVEHFAVQDECRGKGCGALALAALRERYEGLPVVLEVEPPETDTARRRIAFYERNGFRLSPHDYLQPPYRKGGEWFPLRLMTTDTRYLDDNVETVCARIYNKVYRQP